jgi:hypothetical protein
VAVDRKE